MLESTARKKYCDLVMKGGVTSGIVYPMAVQKLSEEYWFKNIGGTSAGAIAAGVTAAAECGRRRSGNDAGFKRVAQLPGDLAADNFLLSLFRPDPATRRVFAVMLAAMAAKQSHKPMWVAFASTLCKNFIGPLCLAVLLALLPCVLLWYWIGGNWIPYALLGLLACLILVPWFVLRSLLGEARRSLLGNSFGFCSGFDGKARPGEPPLTNWLCSLLNEIAGQGVGKPLTFGDLWNAPDYPNEPLIKYEYRCVEQEKRSINLEVMTTNLTLGCPSRIPFETKGFYFNREEWGRLFPTEVVDWMVVHQYKDARKVRTLDGKDLIGLPEMHDLPIVVAVRMSLSFPILLSAVPLYAVDYTLKKNFNPPEGVAIDAERCWFSDGGISSNFPIHFFDSPLPRWPTFGIDLKSPHPDHNTEAEYVWLPTGNREGLQPTWNRFEDHGLFGFLAAILNVMQNWRDNLQMLIPGYRDRIVHISHTDREGGLNLKMDQDVIRAMSDRGRRAGEALLKEFSWKNHAWIRYRSGMCCLETTLEKFANSYRNPIPQDECVWSVIQGEGAPPSYQWQPGQDIWAAKSTKDLVALALDWLQGHECFCNCAPRPRPESRIAPRV